MCFQNEAFSDEEVTVFFLHAESDEFNGMVYKSNRKSLMWKICVPYLRFSAEMKEDRNRTKAADGVQMPNLLFPLDRGSLIFRLGSRIWSASLPALHEISYIKLD